MLNFVITLIVDRCLSFLLLAIAVSSSSFLDNINFTHNLRGACLVETSYLFIWYKQNENIKKSI
jgi:hypothetical protein